MSKQLYEEALADVKRLKEVAEDNAKQSIIEAVAPRIRDLIENELLHEGDDLEDVAGAPGSIDKPGELMTDDDSDALAASISSPDEEGKVTLDLDALTDDAEYELDVDSVSALAPLVSSSPYDDVVQVESTLQQVGEQLLLFKGASKLVRETLEYSSNISQLISRVKNTYNYVRESIGDVKKQAEYEAVLESYHKELQKLQEQKMLNKNRKRMHEGDVSLKLTGLPDDIDLDSIGVDLISGAGDEEEESVPEDLGGEEESSEDSDKLDLDLGGEDEDEEESAESQKESQDMDDDDVVEIDESMLRREISRMRRIREQQEMDQQQDDDLEEAQDSREHGGNVAPKSMGSGAASNKAKRSIPENICRQIAIVESALRIANKEKDVARINRLQRVSRQLSNNLVESVAKRRLVESKKGSRSNSVGRRPAESSAATNLRQKLTESNLFNTKLVCTNKLLQNENLSKKQKAGIIERLDEAKSIREVQLVYESLVRTLQGATNKSALSESRVRGSASTTTRPSATLMTEGSEVDRWQQLAGIHK